MTGSPLAPSLPQLSVVLGGARSGKSRLAEGLARSGAPPYHYFATAEAFDDEMRARIARHRADRGAGWITQDAPLALAGALRAVRDGTVLVDCATLWLSNHLLAGSDLGPEADALIDACGACAAPVIVVSNEVGAGIVPDNALARRFRDAQGRLNQRLAAASGLAVLVVAGLPVVLKGHLPGEGL